MEQINYSTQNNTFQSKMSLKRVRFSQTSKKHPKVRNIKQNQKSKFRMMHRATKHFSKMAQHTLSSNSTFNQSQMIIHKSTNIRRLVLPTPIIHQDQESVFVPMRVTQNKTLELYNPSMDVREKTQTTFEQTIKIKKEPESDNEGDINNDGIEEFVEHEQLEEEIIQNFSGDIKETVQGNKFCWNYFDGIRMVTFNPVLSIKQEPMNEEFSEKSLEDTRPTFDPNISIKQEPLTEETPERSFEDTRPTFDPNINIKQEPISERAEDIENARIIQKCYDYGKFIEGKLKAFSATTRETVLFEFAKVISKAHDGFYE